MKRVSASTATLVVVFAVAVVAGFGCTTNNTYESTPVSSDDSTGHPGSTTNPGSGTSSPGNAPPAGGAGGPAAVPGAPPAHACAYGNAWSAADPLPAPLVGQSAILLASGKVLIAAGGSATSELYDPATGKVAPTGTMHHAPRFNHTATLLPSGKVLVVGGEVGLDPTASAEIYDPSTGSWTETGSLKTQRTLHSAALLSSGKVLVTGGGARGQDNATAFLVPGGELYDPATGTWSDTGSSPTRRGSGTATVLSSGKVLVAGGATAPTAEIYDPTSGTWSNTGALLTNRSNHSATLLPSGRVLIAGGVNDDTNDDGVDVVSAELYDPSTGTFSDAGSLSASTSVYASQAALLPSGQVLVAGTSGSQIYDETKATWTSTAAFVQARGGASLTVLPSGEVLLAGGEPPDAVDALATVERLACK